MKNQPQIDGVRAITHISLIALHASMLMTAHMPSSGQFWKVLKSSYPYTMAQAGGVQVDVCFMVSAYLLTMRMLKSSSKLKYESVLNFTLQRALRTLPCILVIAAVGLLLGDSWDKPYRTMSDSDGNKGEELHWRLLSSIFYYMNYLNPRDYGSFSMSLTWSCCVDLHANLVIFCIIKSFAKFMTTDVNIMAARLRWIFLFLAVLSVFIRGYLFEKDSINLFLLGQYSHFGLLMTDSSLLWIKDYYGHVWHTENSAAALSFQYMSSMYMPSHTRFGPFAVGAFLACNVMLSHRESRESSINKGTTLGFVFSWIFTTISLAMIITPCLPADDNAPIEAQLFATAALRTLAASSVAFLLYRTLVPSYHNWHWPVLSSFFCLKIWEPLSKLSFCSYLIHFRLLMELCFRPQLRSMLNMDPPNHFDENRMMDWFLYLGKLFVNGALISYGLAFIMHYFVEVPCLFVTDYYFKRRVGMSNSSSSTSISGRNRNSIGGGLSSSHSSYTDISNIPVKDAVHGSGSNSNNNGVISTEREELKNL